MGVRGPPQAAAPARQIVVGGWDEVFILNLNDKTAGAPRKIWSWRAKNRRDLPDDFKGLVNSTDECKPLIERYLKKPPRAPAYRAGREHAAFVTNLPLSADDIRARMLARLSHRFDTPADRALGPERSLCRFR